MIFKLKGDDIIKKTIIIFGLIAILATVGAVAAENIDGVDFNIPDGYAFNTSNFAMLPLIDASGNAYTLSGSSNSYINGNDEIRIGVFPSDSQLTLEDLGSSGEKKTINGKEGYLINMTDTVNFEYLDGNYIITIQCPSSVSLESIII